ncbi:general transcription factor IIF, polypeptide 1, isoform CRA_d, partial [Mus musculus]
LEMSSDASDASGEEGSRTSKAKKKAPVTKAGRKKKKKKGSDDEAFEDSDDGDFEGQEVDYMSDGSSSSPDETEGKPKVPQQEDGPKGSGSHRGGVQRAPVGQGLPVQKQQAPLLPCGLQPASWSRGSGRVRLQQPSV